MQARFRSIRLVAAIVTVTAIAALSFTTPASASGLSFMDQVTDLFGIAQSVTTTQGRIASSNELAATANLLSPEPKRMFAATYTWNQAAGGVFSTASNWTPNRTTPAVDDVLVFNNGSTGVVTNVTTQTIGQLSVGGGTNVTLQAGAAAQQLTISGGAGALSIANGSQLNVSGTNVLTITVATGSSASISGSMTFSSTAVTAHRFVGIDASSITVNSGGSITQGQNATGNLFTGGSTTAALFTNGSTFDQIASSSATGGSNPFANAVFQPTSLYKYEIVGGTPSFSGRTYGNFEYNASSGATVTGGTAMSIGNITIDQGTFNYNMTGITGHTINGTISVASGAVLNFAPAATATVSVKGNISFAGNVTFNPAVASTYNLNGTATQTVSGAGNFGTNANATLNISNAAGVSLQRNFDNTVGLVTVASGGVLNTGTSVVQGTGTFTLSPGGTLGIGSVAGITTGATGNIQTTTRTFDGTTATYLYNGALNQAVGNALPASVANLTIANTGPGGNQTVTGNAGQTVTGLLLVQQGIYAGASTYNNVQVNNFGTLTASAGGTINVGGNWTNNNGISGFNANGSTVNFNGPSGQTIAGDTTFFNFTKSTVSAQTLNFTAGSLTTVTNSLTLNGAASNLLSLRSTTSGIQWRINPSTLQSVSFVDVQDSNNIGNTITPVSSVNSGNNLGWVFPPPPTVSASTAGPLAFGSVTVGNTSPVQSYTVGGTNLTANLVVTAPTDFQVSTSATSGFGSTVSLTPSSGTVATTTIYVLYAPSSAGANNSNSISNASTGTTTQNVSVTGTGVAATCTPPPSGLVAWYPAESNANDIVGGNNGALENGATAASAGKVGTAFSFDGVNADVSIPSMNLGNAYTIETWVKPAAAPTSGYMILIGNVYSSTNFGTWYLRPDLSLEYWNNNVSRLQTGPNVVQPGQWAHIALTRNASDGFIRIYVNGVLAGATSVSVNSTFNNPVRLGFQFATTSDKLYNGLMDEVSFYNRDLSATELTAIYNQSSAGKCVACAAAPSGMVAWYRAENNTLDTRGGGNGVFEGTAAYISGKVGQAYSFNGTDADVKVPASPAINVGANGNGFSIDTWINPTSTASRQPIVEWNDGTGNGSGGGPLGYGAHLWLSVGNAGALTPGSLYVNFIDTAGTSHVVYTPAGLVSAGSWQHIAVTFDRVTGNVNVYLNGAAQSLSATNIGTGTSVQTGYDLYYGYRKSSRFPGDAGSRFTGAIDEAELFNRPLTGTEVQNIYNASSAGKCTGVGVGSGLAGWWPGDGDLRDISGNGNNGTANGLVTYNAGLVGQSFGLTGSSGIVVADSPSLNPTTQMTLEGWLYPTTDTFSGNVMAVAANKETVSTVQFEFARRLSGGACTSGGGIPTGNFAVYIGGLSGLPDDCRGWVNANAGLPLNTWSHVALTYDGAVLNTYVNGALTRSIAATGTITSSNGSLRLGQRIANGEVWVGGEDEISLYNRGLSASEVQSVFNAGVSGKYKTSGTLTGVNVTSNEGGDASVTFPTVVTAGTTQQVPLDPATLPTLTDTPLGLYYDISTSAVYTGSPVVCFNLPLVTAVGPFSYVRIKHLEAGAWVDRTNLASLNFATRTACTTALPSLSPFALVFGAPTAAGVSLSGRVTTSDGRGIRNVSIIVTGSSLSQPLRALTGPFGYYQFDGLTAGETYVVTATAKRYAFTTPSQVVTLNDSLTGVDFVGSP